MEKRVKRVDEVGNEVASAVFRQIPEGEDIEDYADEDLYGGRRGEGFEVLPDDAVVVEDEGAHPDRE